jgi:beta-lactamase class A
MVGALLAAALLAVAAKPPNDQTVGRIAALEKSSGRHLGVAALDTGNGRKIEYRPNERFLMCSTFKALAAAAVLQRVDEEKEHLDRFVPYHGKDLLEYAPMTKEHVKEGGMKLGELCAAAIELSDNTAGNLILHSIGGPRGLTNFLRSLSDTKTRSDRMEPELNNVASNPQWDTTTPAAMRNDWVKILTTNLLSPKSREQLASWLAHNQTGAKTIRAGVSSNWKVGDKTGRSRSGALNDVAILRPPDGKPIFLAIYSTGPHDDWDAQSAVLAEVARIVAQSLRPDDSKMP